MTKEEDILAALDKPSAVYPLQQRLDSSSKSTEVLQDLFGPVVLRLELPRCLESQSSFSVRR
jgi:hypothetical protein